MRSKTRLLLVLLALIHLPLLFAGFVAPYNPSTQDRELPLCASHGGCIFTVPQVCTGGHLYISAAVDRDAIVRLGTMTQDKFES